MRGLLLAIRTKMVDASMIFHHGAAHEIKTGRVRFLPPEVTV